MRMDASTGRRDPTYVSMGDAYFRRLLIPLVVTLLFMFGVVAIIYAPPGVEITLPTAAASLTVFNPLK